MKYKVYVRTEQTKCYYVEASSIDEAESIYLHEGVTFPLETNLDRKIINTVRVGDKDDEE